MLTRQRYKLRLLIEKLSIRERYLMLISLFAVILLTGQVGLIVVGLDNHDPVRDRIAQTKAQTQAMRQALLDYQAALNNPQIAALESSNQDLQTRIEQLESRIADINSQLMAPDRMISLLKELLNGYDNLTVTRFEVLPVETIESNIGGGNLFYQHGLAIEMTGEFEALNDYLATIEALSGELFWDDLIIETETFPSLTIELRVHTLSQDEDWLNV